MRPALIPLVLTVFILPACEDETCADCRDEKCADLVSYCEEDSGCGCLSDCLGDDGIPGVQGCLGKCGLEERPAAFILVEECVAVACPDSDECDTPPGYTAPEQLGGGGEPGDIAGGDLEDCAFDDGVSFSPDGAELQLLGADGEVCVHLRRTNQGAGNLANTSWGLDEMWVGPLGGVARVEKGADACWYSSHHNFRDFAHVWTGTRRHSLQLLEDGHGGARTYRLYTFEGGPLGGDCPPLAEGDKPIGDVIELFPAP